MVPRDLAARKIARATAWVNDAEALLRRPRDEFLADRQARDLATFYVFLAIQECMDIAAHWISDVGLGPAEDAGASFDLLADHGLIPAPLATEMRAAVGLRNRVAHGYATVDHARLYEEATRGLDAIRRFLLATAEHAGL